MIRLALTTLVAAQAFLAGCSPSDTTIDREPTRIITDRCCSTVYSGCDPVFRYRYDGVAYKPYVDALWTPGVVNILRDAPHDHLHHHGLMFAITVDGINYWEEGDKAGKQIHRGPIKECQRHENLYDIAGIQGQLEWIDPDGKVALNEHRVIEYVRLEQGTLQVSLLNWLSHFTLPPGSDSAQITGTFYHGLGARFVESFDGKAKFFNADGKTGVEGTNMAHSRWCAFHATAGDTPVTFAMFESALLNKYPVKRPVTWFSMIDHFTYISATRHLHEEPMTIKQGEQMDWFYGVAVWQGHIKPEEIDAIYRQWVDLTASPPQTVGTPQ